MSLEGDILGNLNIRQKVKIPMFDEIKYQIRLRNEKKHYSNLLRQQKKSDRVEKIEPEVPAFTHAYKLYSTYIMEKMPNFDLQEYILKKSKISEQPLSILSLGSGTGDWEIDLMEKNPKKISMELIDINKELLNVAKNYCIKHSLNLKTSVQDANNIKLNEATYDFVIVRSSLHHFIELEHIFEQINNSLKLGTDLIVLGEVIGRNGEKLFPETKEIAQKIFDTLPPKFRFNNYTKKIDSIIPDINFSKDSFESIRSEEILPLLQKYFKPKEYVTLDAFLSLLLDFRYGPNYNLNEKLDKSLVETITNLDIHYISNSKLKPVCLFGIFQKK